MTWLLTFRACKTKTNKTKNITQYVLNATIYKQKQITSIRHKGSYEQPEVKTNWTLFLCGNRNGYQRNSEISYVSFLFLCLHTRLQVILRNVFYSWNFHLVNYYSYSYICICIRYYMCIEHRRAKVAQWVR
jgi:hypothetical protein